MGSKKVKKCECGQALGGDCPVTFAPGEGVTVDWMPPYLRASHRAAGNSGSWPHNGSLRLTVAPGCAAAVTADDAEEVVRRAAIIDPCGRRWRTRVTWADGTASVDDRDGVLEDAVCERLESLLEGRQDDEEVTVGARDIDGGAWEIDVGETVE